MRSSKTHVGVNRLVTAVAHKYGVTIYEYANVGNHLHAVIRLKRIEGFKTDLGRYSLIPEANRKRLRDRARLKIHLAFIWIFIRFRL